jgi:hypothetical protein
MGKFYAGLVLPTERSKAKGFNARAFFEQQLQKCDCYHRPIVTRQEDGGFGLI